MGRGRQKGADIVDRLIEYTINAALDVVFPPKQIRFYGKKEPRKKTRVKSIQYDNGVEYFPPTKQRTK